MRGAQGQKVFMAERKIKALAQYQTRFTPDDVTQIIQSLTNREFSPNLDVQVEQLLMAIAANQALNEAQQQQLCLVAKLTNNLEAFKGRRGYATQHGKSLIDSLLVRINIFYSYLSPQNNQSPSRDQLIGLRVAQDAALADRSVSARAAAAEKLETSNKVMVPAISAGLVLGAVAVVMAKVAAVAAIACVGAILFPLTVGLAASALVLGIGAYFWKRSSAPAAQAVTPFRAAGSGLSAQANPAATLAAV